MDAFDELRICCRCYYSNKGYCTARGEDRKMGCSWFETPEDYAKHKKHE